MSELPPMATPAQLSTYLNVPVETLKFWRYQGRGPRFVKVENRVRYRRADVEKYVASNTRQTTGTTR